MAHRGPSSHIHTIPGPEDGNETTIRTRNSPITMKGLSNRLLSPQRHLQVVEMGVQHPAQGDLSISFDMWYMEIASKSLETAGHPYEIQYGEASSNE